MHETNLRPSRQLQDAIHQLVGHFHASPMLWRPTSGRVCMLNEHRRIGQPLYVLGAGPPLAKMRQDAPMHPHRNADIIVDMEADQL